MMINYIVARTHLPTKGVNATLQLLDEGATVPFIARYRKEKTGNLDDEAVFKIQSFKTRYEKLNKRKTTILESIKEEGKLTPHIREQIERSWDENEIEDLYLPYKKKRKTKADVARENGLEPLAKIIMTQLDSDIQHTAKRYLNPNVESVQDAIQGAQDIIAEWISEDLKSREILRSSMRKYGKFKSTVVRSKKEEAATYRDYWDFSENLHRIPSHRVLAILRGTKEGVLRSGIEVDMERFIANICKFRIRKQSTTASVIEEAIKDSVKRLIFPSVENQVINEVKDKAEKEAVGVFTKNLSQLLLAAPLGEKRILALDPGFRTGCKLVCLDKNGQLIDKDTIYPHPPQNQKDQALSVICNCLEKYGIKHIAIGNGTAGRETQEWLEESLADKDIQLFLVNEDGASIYSASEIAREEFPHDDVTVRGAVSIGRRLMDPLSELVKIDPKSIGVGQYQHDITPALIKEHLDQTVTSCVNSVGINLNTASKYLLQYISGLGPATAQNIIEYREENRGFNSRAELSKVSRLGKKTYEQAVGFLRVKNGDHPLDDTGIHPESYPIVNRMAKDLDQHINSLRQNEETLKKINLQKYTTTDIGLPTLQDIISELIKPGHDPRGVVEHFQFDQRIRTIEDLQEGMIVTGIVSNLTNFGAFVNIGLKNDGLIHISQISDRFIRDPAQILALSQKVQVKVIGIDTKRGRINLSLKY